MSSDKTRKGESKGLRSNENKPGHEDGTHNNQEKNAGSGTFNEGSEGDPDYDDGIKVSAEEKRTGHRPLTSKKD